MTRIENISAEYSIKYPEVESEFEVQAWIFSRLKDAGFDVRGEV